MGERNQANAKQNAFILRKWEALIEPAGRWSFPIVFSLLSELLLLQFGCQWLKEIKEMMLNGNENA